MPASISPHFFISPFVIGNTCCNGRRHIDVGIRLTFWQNPNGPAITINESPSFHTVGTLPPGPFRPLQFTALRRIRANTTV